MDTLGPIEQSFTGMKYVIAIMDTATSITFAYPTKSRSAANVAAANEVALDSTLGSPASQARDSIAGIFTQMLAHSVVITGALPRGTPPPPLGPPPSQPDSPLRPGLAAELRGLAAA